MSTKETTDALIGIAAWFTLFSIPFNGLVTTIITGHIATSTLDTFIEINVWTDNVVTIEVFCWNDVLIGFANKFMKRIDALFNHVVFKTIFHVFNNTIAILHNGCCNLESCCTN